MHRLKAYSFTACTNLPFRVSINFFIAFGERAGGKVYVVLIVTASCQRQKSDAIVNLRWVLGLFPVTFGDEI